MIFVHKKEKSIVNRVTPAVVARLVYPSEERPWRRSRSAISSQFDREISRVITKVTRLIAGSITGRNDFPVRRRNSTTRVLARRHELHARTAPRTRLRHVLGRKYVLARTRLTSFNLFRRIFTVPFRPHELFIQSAERRTTTSWNSDTIRSS